MAQARYSEAETLFKRALTIRPEAFGADSKMVGMSANGLARDALRVAAAVPALEAGADHFMLKDRLHEQFPALLARLAAGAR